MRRSSLFWGAILLLAGVLLLLDNLGILDVDVWSLIWPLFLIAVGVWFLLGTVFGKRFSQSEHVSIPLANASRARVRINHGAGRLNIFAGDAGAGDLAEGDFGGGLDLSARPNGDTLDVSLGVPVQFFPMFWSPGYSLDWSVGFNRNVPLSLNLNTGAGEARLELADLNVSDLRLQTGASSSTVTLPAHAGSTHVEVESGAAAVNLRIPEGVAARIRVRSGLAGISVDQHRFPRQGEYYQSPDYDTASNKADIFVQTGVGSVDVR
ncbi:MAG: hypothetical protein EHM70_20200 [Chloroflexota bacterium]|nr:MAG: hypothetical protein EHM70_20200 [Chloroflexota bacterium]